MSSGRHYEMLGRLVLGWLGECGGCKYNILRALAERKGATEARFRKTLERLVEAGRIRPYRQQGGLHYRLTGGK